MNDLTPDMLPQPAPKPASEELKRLVREHVGDRGRLYAEIPHPDFDGMESGHKTIVRRKIIEPHLEYRGGTALDIGAYLATFSHWLESLGYEVTAVERNAQCVAIGRAIRDLWGMKYDIREGLFYDLAKTDYDVVLALNVFHHSLKKQKLFEQLEHFLGKLTCRMMIFEPHNPAEKQMATAYRPMSPEDFAQFVATKTGLKNIQQIGVAGHRKLFKLQR